MAKRRLTARQVRYLWAIGAFSRKGGTKRGVVYDRAAAQRARAGGGSGRRIPSKAERDATREMRVGAGKQRAVSFFAKAASKEARANSTVEHKVMTSKYPGRFKDTGREFGAGTTIRYVPGVGAYEKTPRYHLRRVMGVRGTDSSLSSRAGRVGAQALSTPRDQRIKPGKTLYEGVRGVARTPTKRDVVDIMFSAVRDAAKREYASAPRPRKDRKSFAAHLRKVRREKGGAAARDLLARHRQTTKFRYMFKNPDRR